MTVQGTNSRAATDLLVQLDRDLDVPLHRQIEASIRDGIRSGRLPFGTSLPPSRAIAGDLGVSRGVVVEAYEQLVAEGYLTSRPGGYTQVAIGEETAEVRPHRAEPVEPRIDFGYGRANVAQFPREAWLRSIKTVLNETPNERFGYLSGRGARELREALAIYLNRVRGTSAKPNHFVITNGYAQGIGLIIQVLARSGATRVAVEDPSDADVPPLLAAAGLELVGIPVDESGIRVDHLEQCHADALFLTPSHQWPTGAVLSPRSRAAVLRWAESRNALVVEDDYDAEFRYDRAPIGALQGLAPDRVIHAGSVSKTLAPGIRLGWLVLPPRLSKDVALAKYAADRGSSVMDQLTFADFLTRGEFDRHLRRMRPVYRRRRDTLVEALARHTPDLRPAGISAGLHVVTWLPPDLPEDAVVEAAARHGVGVYGVGPFRVSPSKQGGLIFGYSSLAERSLAEGVAVLAEAIAELRAG